MTPTSATAIDPAARRARALRTVWLLAGLALAAYGTFFWLMARA
jgi:hypothetical protein